MTPGNDDDHSKILCLKADKMNRNNNIALHDNQIT